MKIDYLIRKILPQDDKFFRLLEESTQNLLKASHVLKTLPACKTLEEREKVVTQLRDLEHEGDALTHKIFSELNSTFVTPLDREDIHHLTSSLDDIMDHIDGSAARFTLYRIQRCPDLVGKLIDVLHLSVSELHRGVGLLRNLRQYEELQKVFKKVNEYENEADALFEIAIADLFDHEKDPIQIIKLKEIFVGLETATDKCEDAANVLESILIKHA